MTSADLAAWQAALPTDLTFLAVLLTQLHTEWIAAHLDMISAQRAGDGPAVHERILTLSQQIRVVEHCLID